MRKLLIVSMSLWALAGCEKEKSPNTTASPELPTEQASTNESKEANSGEEKGKTEVGTEKGAGNRPSLRTKAAISSVYLSQDCPDSTKPQAKPLSKPSAGGYTKPADEPRREIAPARKRAKGHGVIRQPCSQSNLQLSITNLDRLNADVSIESIELIAPDGKALAKLKHRQAMEWNGGSYSKPWDGKISESTEINKVSLKLSPPSWAPIEEKIGTSYGKMFRLRATLKIGTNTIAAMSGEFERRRPNIIRT